MSAERSENPKPLSRIRDYAGAAALGILAGGAGTLYGGHEGKKIGAEEMLELVNEHNMTPRVASELQKAGVSESEIVQLDVQLKTLLLQELKRLREKN